MADTTRVFSRELSSPSAADLEAVLHEENPEARLDVVAGTNERWTTLLLVHEEGEPVARITRGEASEAWGGALVTATRARLEGAKPVSGAAWVRAFLTTTETVYEIVALPAIRLDEAADALRAITTSLWSNRDAVVETEGEGFANATGHQVVWDFGPDAAGPWAMALRDGDLWVAFDIDLGDAAARADYLEGRLPAGARTGR